MRISLVLGKKIGGRSLRVCRQPLQEKLFSSTCSSQIKEHGLVRTGHLAMAKENEVGNETEGGLQIKGEEVEVKLRIPDSASFAAAKSLFLPSFKNVLNQENHFFDGSNEELSSQKVVLRIRFYNSDQKAIITCKGKQVLKDGIGRAPEEEEEIDVQIARSFVQDPDAMLLYDDSNLIRKLKGEFEFKDGLKYLGGFDNQRSVYEWRGYSLELDLTSYPWGCLHEIECETNKPEDLKQILEKLLAEQCIPFSDAKKSKFANFKDQTLE